MSRRQTLVTTDGKVYTAGDVKSQVSIQSISKVFTMAKVIEESGPDAVSPPLDEAGNSVRAQKAIADISNALGGNPLASKPR